MRRVGAVVLLMPTLALALAGCGDRALWDRWCSERDLWHAERSAQQVIARGASVRAADRERVERALDAVAERLPSAPGAEGPSHDVARLAGRALVLIGRLHESAGDIDGARTAYQRVVSAPAADEGMRSEAHAALAALALRAARFDEALASLARAVHARGMRVVGDLTLNHCGVGHEWFQAAERDAAARRNRALRAADVRHGSWQLWTLPTPEALAGTPPAYSAFSCKAHKQQVWE